MSFQVEVSRRSRDIFRYLVDRASNEVNIKSTFAADVTMSFGESPLPDACEMSSFGPSLLTSTAYVLYGTTTQSVPCCITLMYTRYISYILKLKNIKNITQQQYIYKHRKLIQKQLIPGMYIILEPFIPSGGMYFYLHCCIHAPKKTFCGKATQAGSSQHLSMYVYS